jgi:hypothetical protein
VVDLITELEDIDVGMSLKYQNLFPILSKEEIEWVCTKKLLIQDLVIRTFEARWYGVLLGTYTISSTGQVEAVV